MRIGKNSLVGSENSVVLQAGRSGNHAVGRIGMKPIRQGISFLHDVKINVLDLPAVQANIIPEPFLPMAIDHNAPSFGSTGDFGGTDDGNANVGLIGGQECFGGL